MRTVEEMIERVGLPAYHQELVCMFLLVFSRFEAALKRSGYIRQDGQRLIVEWRRYARENVGLIEDLKKVAAVLVARPPERQRWAGGVLDFVAEAAPTSVTSEWILEMVYRVRNNLFHGGKWPADPARDGELLHSCLAALAYYVDLDPRVGTEYFGE